MGRGRHVADRSPLTGVMCLTGLLLETNDGKATLVQCSNLATMLRTGHHGADRRTDGGGVQLVFAGACSSHQAALAFADAGVPHVIGSHKTIKDLQVRQFASFFYPLLLSGRSVMEAFDRATAAYSYEHDGDNPFELLPVGGDHSQCILADAAVGRWVDESPHPPPSHIGAPNPHGLRGRGRVLADLSGYIRKYRCTWVHGEEGLGKTQMMRAVCRFMHERRWFPDGIIEVDLRRLDPRRRHRECDSASGAVAAAASSSAATRTPTSAGMPSKSAAVGAGAHVDTDDGLSEVSMMSLWQLVHRAIRRAQRRMPESSWPAVRSWRELLAALASRRLLLVFDHADFALDRRASPQAVRAPSAVPAAAAAAATAAASPLSSTSGSATPHSPASLDLVVVAREVSDPARIVPGERERERASSGSTPWDGLAQSPSAALSHRSTTRSLTAASGHDDDEDDDGAAVHRASSVGHGASPRSLESLLRRLLKRCPNVHAVCASRCHPPELLLDASATLRIVRILPVDPASAGRIMVDSFPYSVSHRNCGITDDEYKAHGNDLYRAINMHIPVVGDCKCVPGRITRLATVLSSLGVSTLHDARHLSPELARDVHTRVWASRDRSGSDASHDTLSDDSDDDSDTEDGLGTLGRREESTSDAVGDVRGGGSRRSASLGKLLPGAADEDPAKVSVDELERDRAAAPADQLEEEGGPEDDAAGGTAEMQRMDSNGARLDIAFGVPVVSDDLLVPASSASLQPRRADVGVGARASIDTPGADDASLPRLIARLQEQVPQLDGDGASWWLTMAANTVPGASDPTSVCVPWETLLFFVRQGLASVALHGLHERDFVTEDAHMLAEVAQSHGATNPESLGLTLSGWAGVPGTSGGGLWAWLRECLVTIGELGDLWALRSPPVFFPFLSRHRSRELLTPALESGRTGTFLLRLSSSRPGGVVITYVRSTPHGEPSPFHNGAIIDDIILDRAAGRLDHAAGRLWSVPVHDERGTVAATTLVGMIRAIPEFTWVPALARPPGPSASAEFVSKDAAFAPLHSSAAADSPYRTALHNHLRPNSLAIDSKRA